MYRAAHPGGSPGGLLAAVLTDRWVSVGPRARGQAVRRARPRPRGVTFNDELAWLSPVLDGRLVACHALVIPFVFDTVDLGYRQMLGGAPGEHPPQERGPRRRERRYTR